jgi:hypothetical protein
MYVHAETYIFIHLIYFLQLPTKTEFSSVYTWHILLCELCLLIEWINGTDTIYAVAASV